VIRTLVAVAVVALAVVVVGCGGVEQQPNLAKAVERTEATGSSRIEVRGLTTDNGERVAIQCDGTADYADKQLRFACNRGFGETIVIGDTMYVTGDAFGVQVGKRWVKLSLDEDDTIRDFSPEKLLGMLREASLETERVGEEDVRGEPTVRYRLTVNCEQADVGCSGTAAPVDVWIDDDGLVRRIQLEDNGDPATIEFFDFGAEVDIEPPPADQVTDESFLGTGGMTSRPDVACTNDEAMPISEAKALAALQRHGFTVSSDEQGCFGEVAAVLENRSEDLGREGHVSCFVYLKPPPDAPGRTVRDGVDGGDAELLLANLECMILADSPNAEEKIHPLEAAFQDLLRAIQP
jgi:hypothetical protein